MKAALITLITGCLIAAFTHHYQQLWIILPKEVRDNPYDEGPGIPYFKDYYKAVGQSPDNYIRVTHAAKGLYILSSVDWVGSALWDKRALKFRAIFRYNDKVTFLDDRFGKDGAYQHATGTLEFVPQPNGNFDVRQKWDDDASKNHETHYVIEPIKR